MNFTFQKYAAAALAALTLTAALSGCGAANPAADAPAYTPVPEKEQYTIGLLQYADHPSLDNCRAGFIAGLAEEGFVEGENVTFDYQNAQSDNSVNQQIAGKFAAAKNDLVAAIATPAAQAAFNAAEPAGIPVVYVAVADPVLAQLVGEDGKSGKAVTGVSDLLPMDRQVEMIRAFLPDVKKIGVLYSTGEVNSKSQIELLRTAAEKQGFEVIESGVAAAADIPLATEALAAKVDCINNLTDNLVVSSLATVLDRANKAGIPVFGSEIEQVKNGCLASEGIDYVSLGKQAGKMAAKVLRGEDITKMPFETMTESRTDVNSAALSALGLTLPADIAARATLHE